MPTMTRRHLLQVGAVGAAALYGSSLVRESRAMARSLLDPLAHPKFVNPLPNPIDPAFAFAPVAPNAYEISIAQFSQSLGLVGPDGSPLATTVWGYGSAGQAATYPGRTINAARGTPLTVLWKNELVDGLGRSLPHLLPVDTTLHWAFTHGDATIASDGVPVVTHLHGGHTEDASDGLPEQWFTPGFALRGPDWRKAAFTYDNDQEAGTIWYHDHALGITRLNVYAGLAGFYIIRDEWDTGLPDNPLGLPAFPYEVAIAIQDRTFDASGALVYPSSPMVRDAPEPSVLPEFFGDFVLCNGQAWPVLDVEPRKYRLRLLNGSDSRFYAMQLKPRSGGAPATIVQIGTDGGLLTSPTPLKGALVFGPGERVDVIVDFAPYAGAEVVLTNDAATPFPVGAPVTPTAGRLMLFRVTKPLDASVEERPIAPRLRDVRFAVDGEPAASRELVLFEGTDEHERIHALLGPADSGGLEWDDPITERPARGSVEVWELYNTTPDAHPIHVHLPQFEVLDRAPFKAHQNRKTGALHNVRVGSWTPAPASERGPKDTVQTFPGEVTRIKVPFDRAGRYVWHCHILSHEDHEMMRPYEIV